MINKALLLGFICTVIFACRQQERGDDPVKLNIVYGVYTPSFSDTVIFHPTESYTYEGYNGFKPFLVRIWFPDELHASSENLTLTDLFSFTVDTKNLEPLRDSLRVSYERYVGYSLSKTLGRDDSTLAGKRQSLVKAVMNMNILSKQRSGRYPGGVFPVVVYHHGYGGWSHDNFLFAEYMASHGFVVVCSNYEWPNYDKGFDDGNKDIEFIQAFSKTLPFVDSTRIFAVGHSWGAQSFLYYDNKPRHPFSSTVSLHTTMEHFPELDSIKKYWKSVSRVLLDSTRKTSPTFVFAPQKPSNNYLIFRQSKQADYTYINVKNPISHDGFISLDNMRCFLRSNYVAKEDSMLRLQFSSYQEICAAIREQLSAKQIDWPSHQRLELVK
jgi:pimeloyl-ACP methyl ester carboxylesterase